MKACMETWPLDAIPRMNINFEIGYEVEELNNKPKYPESTDSLCPSRHLLTEGITKFLQLVKRVTVDS